MGFAIDMIKVTRGDAFLVTLASLPRDVTFLIDGGSPSDGDAVAQFIRTYSNNRVDVVIGTHMDEDHIGGLSRVVDACDIGLCFANMPVDLNKMATTLRRQRLLEGMKPGDVWDSIQKSLQDATGLREALARKKLLPRPLLAGHTWQFGDVSIRVVSPTQERVQEAWNDIERPETELEKFVREYVEARGIPVAPPTSPENNASVVIELWYRNVPYALFAGDAGVKVLKEVTQGRSYHFLKVPHHGSDTGLDQELVNQFKANIAYISGGDDRYGHPTADVLAMLRNARVVTLCNHRTEACSDSCPPDGFGPLCHPVDYSVTHRGWPNADPLQCQNNR